MAKVMEAEVFVLGIRSIRAGGGWVDYIGHGGRGE